MRLVSVSGLQGSGKTSLIRRIVEVLHADGKRAAVIVNESGDVKYDGAFADEFELVVESLRGG
jgi:G3E family GTPase